MTDNLLIILCFLSVIQIGVSVAHLRRRWQMPWKVSLNPTEVQKLSSTPTSCTLMKKSAGGWAVLGERSHGHPDIKEALDTPGLAVLWSDGTLEEGQQ